MLKLDPHPLGTRVYVLGRRVHHGTTGLILIGVGLVLLVHDRADWPFTDVCNH